MAFVFTEALQLGLLAVTPFLFERELVEMTHILDRPLPELQGGLVDGASRELSWVVECTIRPPLTAPTAGTYTFHVRECSWSEGRSESFSRLWLVWHTSTTTGFSALALSRTGGVMGMGCHFPIPTSPTVWGLTSPTQSTTCTLPSTASTLCEWSLTP